MTCNIVSLRLHIAKMERFVSLDSNVCPKNLPSGSAEKNPPAMQEIREMWVQSLTLEEEMTTHSSILAWRIPWTVCGVTKSGTRMSTHASLLCPTFMAAVLSMNRLIACTDFLPCKMASLLKNLRAS